MSRQIAVGCPEIGQPARQQLEMTGLLGSDADPVVKERARQILRREPHDEIPGEVDCIELDMGEGVNERGPARRGAERAALGHLLGRTQQRVSWPGGTRRR
jgi:hypothetical protein